MLWRRKQALRYLDAFGARFEEWVKTGDNAARSELLGSLPKLRQLYKQAGTEGAWYFETTLERRELRYGQEARDGLAQTRGAFRDGVTAPAGTSTDDTVPPTPWGEMVRKHAIWVALGFVVGGFIAGFATRDRLDRWIPWATRPALAIEPSPSPPPAMPAARDHRPVPAPSRWSP